MGVDGVRAVNFVELTQGASTNTNVQGFTGQNLYSYTMASENNGEPSNQTGTDDTFVANYGWKYSFVEHSEYPGLILPPNSSSPAVFELKNPNQNIKGVVR